MITIKRIHSVDPQVIFPLIDQMEHQILFERFERDLAAMLKLNYFLIGAYDGEQLVGLMGCWVATKFYCGKYLELDNFVVDKNQRGRGIGLKLVEYAVELAKQIGCDCVMLDAYKGNAAQRLYDRLGFENPGYHRILPLNDAVKARLEYRKELAEL